MLRLALCFVLAASMVLSANPSLAVQSASGCADSSQFGSGCPEVGGEVGGDGATLTGDQRIPGSPGGSGAGPGGSGGSGGSVEPPRPCEEVFAGLCYGEGQDKPGEEGELAPGIPPLMLSDIAHFRPQPATQRMQPDGWMVVGLDTNFYALIDRHVVAGSLLGAPADVRFTPVAYRWTYGDGSSARLTTKGATWQAQGLSEFDPTATSHVYRASGTYFIDLDVEYTAEYRFGGGGWVPLSGTIVLPANRLVATAGDAVTVLVDRHCAQPPAGPGC